MYKTRPPPAEGRKKGQPQAKTGCGVSLPARILETVRTVRIAKFAGSAMCSLNLVHMKRFSDAFFADFCLK